MQAAWGGIVGSFSGVLEPPSDPGADLVRSLSALEQASHGEKVTANAVAAP